MLSLKTLERGKCLVNEEEFVKLFQKELNEVKKQMNIEKERFLKNLVVPIQINENDGFELEISEMENNSNIKIETKKDKTFEDYFKTKIHIKYTYDFLNLKNIDGVIIKSSGEKILDKNSIINSSIRFTYEDIKRSYQTYPKSILKNKNIIPKAINLKDNVKSMIELDILD